MTAPPPPTYATSAEDYQEGADRVRRVLVELVMDMRARDLFPHFVILGPDTVDLPGAYLARLWATRPKPAPTTAVARAGSLEEVLDLLPDGFVFLHRQPEDEPNVLGTAW